MVLPVGEHANESLKLCFAAERGAATSRKSRYISRSVVISRLPPVSLVILCYIINGYIMRGLPIRTCIQVCLLWELYFLGRSIFRSHVTNGPYNQGGIRATNLKHL